MNALKINCTLDTAAAGLTAETFALSQLDRLSDHGVETEMIWAIDHNLMPGMDSFEDEVIEWDAVRHPLLDSRVLVVSRPG